MRRQAWKSVADWTIYEDQKMTAHSLSTICHSFMEYFVPPIVVPIVLLAGLLLFSLLHGPMVPIPV